MLSDLDHVIWNSLSGSHARYAAGTGTARRYLPGFSPILGFADPENPDFRSLEAYARAGEHFYVDRWTGPIPAGWGLVSEAQMLKMVYRGAPIPLRVPPYIVRLDTRHYPEAVDLAALTRPGPFGLRTPELGVYLGIFDDGRLVAMAGERMQVGEWREISGVCTHPRYTGRGLAQQLVQVLIANQQSRGERTFLHVMSANHRARQLYERLGFENYLETTVRVIERHAAPDRDD